MKFNINKGEKLFFIVEQNFSGMELPKISINQTDEKDFFSN